MKFRSPQGTAEVLLGKLEHDLRRLPRHQWDKYLWELSSRFVRFGGSAASLPTTAGGSRGTALD
jgi:hypothetical protein